MRVGIYFAKPAQPWRSVVLELPSNRPGDVGQWPGATLKAIIYDMAKKLGIPHTRTIVRGLSLRGYYRGYIRIYRGKPTAADKALFRRAYEMAIALPGVEVNEIDPFDRDIASDELGFAVPQPEKT